MKNTFLTIILFLSTCVFSCVGAAEDLFLCPETNLMKDLMIVDYWNNKLNDRLPVMYNHLLYGGYINMPSARMGQEGELGLGFAWVPPYHLYSLRCQLTDRFEVSGNYRVFHGIADPVLGPGFGDFSDKGANFKLAIFHPEDSGYDLPGLAIGTEDFIGTRAFKAYYAVLTQVLINYDMEISLGYGMHRIKQWFGGMWWFPFRRCGPDFLSSFSIAAEYDATPYKDEAVEPHPRGRRKDTGINMGFNYRLWDEIDLSMSYTRGCEWAFAASTYYNFGNTKGFLPKIDDSLPYRAPVNLEPIGARRPEDAMTQDLVYAFKDQGLELLQVWMFHDPCLGRTLRLKVLNIKYRTEFELRCRLNHLLAGVIPENVAQVIVTVEGDGIPLYDYRFNMDCVREYHYKQIGAYELEIATPWCEATFPDPDNEALLFRQYREWWEIDFFPKTNTYFGSASGKFKYALGISANLNGFLYDELMYNLQLGYIAFSSLSSVNDMDKLNPSQLINVRSDIVNYYKQKGVTVDEAYIQRTWNHGNGWYTRLALGHFEVEYGGIAGELLYYPLKSCWAFGVEGAILGKRKLNNLWFTSKIRKLDGYQPVYRRFHGSQVFFDVYYEWREAQIDLKMKMGKFLANDWGIRYELSHYFPSGLRVTLWYTHTNGHDKINGQTYCDKGAAFTMPLDIFYTHSDRNRWGYGMSAWLRDVGVSAYSGQELYEMLSDSRKY